MQTDKQTEGWVSVIRNTPLRPRPKSKTPRTDMAEIGQDYLGYVRVGFARQLERELSDANRHVAAKTALLTDACKRIHDLHKRIGEPSNIRS